MNIEKTKFIFEGIQLIISMLAVYLAWKALNTWKKELFGKNKYQYSKKKIDKIKDLRFMIDGMNTKDPMSFGMSQVYVADLVLEKQALSFHKKRIEDRIVLFDYSYMNACGSFDVRKDFEIPERIRSLFDRVLFQGGEKPDEIEDQNPIVRCPDFKDTSSWVEDIDELEKLRFKPFKSQEITYGEFLDTWKQILDFYLENTK